MHDLGQIVYYSDDESLRDFVVLNPEWLTKAISYVLEDEPTRQADGLLDHARLAQIWEDRPGGPAYPARYHPYFLRLMEKFDVSYRLEDDPYRSLIAQLVPHGRPTLPWDTRTAPSGRIRRLTLVCQLSEPAPGLVAWLTVRHHRASPPDSTGAAECSSATRSPRTHPKRSSNYEPPTNLRWMSVRHPRTSSSTYSGTASRT